MLSLPSFSFPPPLLACSLTGLLCSSLLLSFVLTVTFTQRAWPVDMSPTYSLSAPSSGKPSLTSPAHCSLSFSWATTVTRDHEFGAVWAPSKFVRPDHRCSFCSAQPSHCSLLKLLLGLCLLPLSRWQIGLIILREDRRNLMHTSSALPTFLHLQLCSTFPPVGSWAPAPYEGQSFPRASDLKTCTMISSSLGDHSSSAWNILLKFTS